MEAKPITDAPIVPYNAVFYHVLAFICNQLCCYCHFLSNIRVIPSLILMLDLSVARRHLPFNSL
jgi:hypothetical protein